MKGQLGHINAQLATSLANCSVICEKICLQFWWMMAKYLLFSSLKKRFTVTSPTYHHSTKCTFPHYDALLSVAPLTYSMK